MSLFVERLIAKLTPEPPSPVTEDARRAAVSVVLHDETSGPRVLLMKRAGQLEPLHPRTSGPAGIEVTPFVFLSEVAVEPRCGPEALAAFWLPLEAAASGALDGTYTYPGSMMAFPSWTFDGHVIWGLTMRILSDVLARARG